MNLGQTCLESRRNWRDYFGGSTEKEDEKKETATADYTVRDEEDNKSTESGKLSPAENGVADGGLK